MLLSAKICFQFIGSGRRMDPKFERLQRRRAEEKLREEQLRHMEWGKGYVL